MKYEKVDFNCYFDGNYEDSGKSQQDRNEVEKISMEENKKYTDWSEIDH
ncbi:MAG: hypothetical protein ACI4GV_09425 [Acutalibacteraceae bacterium]